MQALQCNAYKLIEMALYDLIIIGAGPAGITAAIYAARQKLKTLVISKDVGGQVALTADIENWVGYQFITGSELTKKFDEHIEAYKDTIELELGTEVIGIEKKNSNFLAKTKSRIYESRVVIIASGKKPRPLNVPGEQEFRGRGLTYCAVCDAPLFPKKDVAVIGGGNSALEAALQLTKIANKIYLINKNPAMKGEKAIIGKVEKNPKVEKVYNAITKEILGDKFVNAIRVEQNGKERKINVQGVFVEIGLIPNTDFIELAGKNKYNEIMVNSNTETNVPGLFAAGDVADVPEKQIVVAAAEGCKAALATSRYLAKLK